MARVALKGYPPLVSFPPTHWLQVSVEERVVARVALKAATFGQDIGASSSSAGGDGSGGGADTARGEKEPGGMAAGAVRTRWEVRRSQGS